MSTITKKVAVFYGAWVLICIVLSVIGYGDSKAGHIYLAFTGMPLALLSLKIVPNGSVIATVAAGLIGWLQWCLIVEACSRWDL